MGLTSAQDFRKYFFPDFFTLRAHTHNIMALGYGRFFNFLRDVRGCLCKLFALFSVQRNSFTSFLCLAVFCFTRKNCIAGGFICWSRGDFGLCNWELLLTEFLNVEIII